jgi:hypothetical protein
MHKWQEILFDAQKLLLHKDNERIVLFVLLQMIQKLNVFVSSMILSLNIVAHHTFQTTLLDRIGMPLSVVPHRVKNNMRMWQQIPW